ncbi:MULTISPECIES: LysE/ArgO family amino acid transporter [unclassified Caballeronia]|uniref:LysE/ArgO family amino acid transporter n=1 Tax=unclassified Caballeronia TaxID=2646786 RepID=UPI00285A8A08|nr:MULTISPECIES: LysE/ArgO family amino acid transporter [unclassified Caballeronia]MDR5741205.1 LysE/ArgO family amino acid transporter [Caballeronia sp. LZ016]MDR5807103.1 LysE/ArgO family amino acid transporter [Caballeronia sp. LZ019]
MNSLSFWHGAALCASLIVTIGAQNAYVLRQGILRSHVGKIVVLCTLSDFALIAAGVGGASALVESYPRVVHALLYVGLAYLLWFGLNALWRAWKPSHATIDAAAGAKATSTVGAGAAILTTLGLTWLNPHVYLDTFLLIGTAGAREPAEGRLTFAIGAMAASLVWFIALGYGARVLAPLFRRAGAWRVFDGAIGAMVLAIAFTQVR